MSIKSNIDLKRIKNILNQLYQHVEGLEEFGHAYHPQEFDKKYQKLSHEIIEHLLSADAIFDELNAESVENFGY